MTDAHIADKIGKHSDMLRVLFEAVSMMTDERLSDETRLRMAEELSDKIYMGKPCGELREMVRSISNMRTDGVKEI